MALDDETATVQHTDSVAARYLLVLEGGQPRAFSLPAGVTTIGRSPECTVQLTAAAVSRKHTSVELAGDRVVVRDLGSQHGTRVNGNRIDGSQVLVGGDVITVGGVTIVYHDGLPRQRIRQLLAMDELLGRCQAELDRAKATSQPLAVALLVPGPLRTPVDLLRTAVSDRLRDTDWIAWESTGEAVILAPASTALTTEALAGRLVEIAAASAPEVRVGYACYPADAATVPELLTLARAAVVDARAGSSAPALANARTIDVGGRTAIVADPAMARVYSLAQRLGESTLPVLVNGETGAGKELAARAIHAASSRSTAQFLAINCAAIRDTLLESELFGYEKGAFTGADHPKPGLLERADGGTVFLDEVGELSLEAQAKLLRVLETRSFTRLGGSRERTVDVRLVAATNRDLQRGVADGGFRADLFFRLTGAVLTVPPLRERGREIPILAQLLLRSACDVAKRPQKVLSDGALVRLAKHSWPGNVRELKNLMEWIAVVIVHRVIEARHFEERLGTELAVATPQPDPEREGAAVRELNKKTADAPTPPPPADHPTPSPATMFRPLDEELQQLERRRIVEALDASGGNQTKAAELIGMPLRTFQLKLKRHGIRGPRS